MALLQDFAQSCKLSASLRSDISTNASVSSRPSSAWSSRMGSRDSSPARVLSRSSSASSCFLPKLSSASSTLSRESSLSRPASASKFGSLLILPDNLMAKGDDALKRNNSKIIHRKIKPNSSYPTAADVRPRSAGALRRESSLTRITSSKGDSLMKHASGLSRQALSKPSSLRRRSGISGLEEQQDIALCDLLKDIEETRPELCSTTEDIVAYLLQDVVLHDGEFAFPKEDIVEETKNVLRCEAATLLLKSKLASGVVTAIYMVLEVLCPRHDLRINDVVGQILWRHRKTSALKNKQHSKVLENLSWAAGSDPTDQAILESVSDVYQRITAPRNGSMSSREWYKIVRIVRTDVAVSNMFKVTSDAERLWYSHTHSNGDVNYEISYRKFKLLLLDWADEMQLHPYHVLRAISQHFQASCD